MLSERIRAYFGYLVTHVYIDEVLCINRIEIERGERREREIEVAVFNGDFDRPRSLC